MSQLRVPRVHIVIPSSHTSRHKFEPRYAIPLFAAEWQANLADPSVPVHEEEHPAECKDPAFYWKDIESVETELAQYRSLFPNVFHRVYTSDQAFYAAVEVEMERGIAVEAAIERALTPAEELPVEIPEWLQNCAIKGLTDKLKRDMVLRGLDTPAAVQSMDKLKVAEVVGGKVAKALKALTDGAVAPAAAVSGLGIPAPLGKPLDIE